MIDDLAASEGDAPKFWVKWWSEWRRVVVAISWLIGVMWVLSWVLSRVITQGFTRVEDEGARETLRVAQNAWAQNVRNFSENLSDWAAWDDTYRFASDGNGEYVRSNLESESLQILQVDAVAIVKRDGTIVFGTGFNRHTKRASPLPPELKAQLRPNTLLTRFSSITQSIEGIISTRRGPMLVASRPIVTSRLQGPARGTILMARLVDDNEIARLKRSSGLEITLSPVTNSTRQNNFRVQRLDGNRLRISAGINDLRGQTVTQINVMQERALWRQGQDTLRLFSLFFWTLGLGAGLCALLVERRLRRDRTRLSEEKHFAQKQLIEAGARFGSLMDSTPDAIILADEAGHIRDWNGAAQQMFGYAKSEVLGHSLSLLFADPAAISDAIVSNAIVSNGQRPDFTLSNSHHQETRGVRVGGETFPLELSLATWQTAGERFYAGIMRDQSERQRATQTVQNSLREKEVLLKEIHHRVKNNMQVISSILSLQASQSQDASVRAGFRDSQQRIKSMALIHEKLYRSHDLARVDIGDYLQVLATGVLRSYPAGGRVQMECSIRGIWLDIDRAAPCGLLVNELISNALKHAFPPQWKSQELARPRLQLHLQVLADDGADNEKIRAGKDELVLQLEVGDNGVGVPHGFDFRATESLGLQLVTTLAQQLNGDIALHSVRAPNEGHGTRWILRFPVPNDAQTTIEVVEIELDRKPDNGKLQT